MESDGIEPQNDSEEQVINKDFTKRTEIGNLNFYNQIIKWNSYFLFYYSYDLIS